MTTKILIFILASLVYQQSNAQSGDSLRGKYNCEVMLTSSRSFVLGEIYETGDSAILFYKRLSANEITSSIRFEMVNLPVDQIKIIRVRKKGKVEKGLLFGTLGAVAAGVAIGFATLDKSQGNSAWEGEVQATAFSIMFLPFGIAAGTIIGSEKITIPIEGGRNNYLSHRKELITYSIMNK